MEGDGRRMEGDGRRWKRLTRRCRHLAALFHSHRIRSCQRRDARSSPETASREDPLSHLPSPLFSLDSPSLHLACYRRVEASACLARLRVRRAVEEDKEAALVLCLRLRRCCSQWCGCSALPPRLALPRLALPLALTALVEAGRVEALASPPLAWLVTCSTGSGAAHATSSSAKA